jgi:hypothetical protein
MHKRVRRSRVDRLALELDAHQRARRILTRVDFHSPEQARLQEQTGQAAPGHYAVACLNVGFLLALAHPLPSRLRRKMAAWERAVRESRTQFFLALAPFGEPKVSKRDAEECVRKLRGDTAARTEAQP